MKRRKFVYTTMAAGSLPFLGNARDSNSEPAVEKYLGEIRRYEIKFRASQQVLTTYLTDVLQPALKRLGATRFMVLGGYGLENPVNLWVIIGYPTASAYINSQNPDADPIYREAAGSYDALAPEAALYNRYGSSLLHAFDGMPAMAEPDDGASIYELRTYEGYSEDALRRKIKMFNEGEIAVFLKTGLHPVFFGKMIAVPYRPCLTYMLRFRDMEERDANWSNFIAHPDWKEMNSKEEYANSVSNIRRIFLTKLA